MAARAYPKRLFTGDGAVLPPSCPDDGVGRTEQPRSNAVLLSWTPPRHRLIAGLFCYIAALRLGPSQLQ